MGVRWPLPEGVNVDEGHLALSTSALAALSDAGLAALTPGQVAAITAAQAGALSSLGSTLNAAALSMFTPYSRMRG